MLSLTLRQRSWLGDCAN
uniref:Uncharacterized protein n=1 Tax=Timema bartmani TaxID=61472 RepID=A0A7R9FCX9_9NEOP|nr:unnamed protein product [Timema bartmani]